jgi:cation diffusion facilitator CzcD-associated flavoprotein CzcO
LRILSKAEASPLGAVVVGGGPAGAGLLLAARGAGLLDSLLALPIRIIERGESVGVGELGNYAIRSDSYAESFFRAVEAPGEPSLSLALAAPAGQDVLRRRGAPVTLAAATAFLAEVSEELRGALAASGRDPFLTGFEAVSACRTAADGGAWRVRCRAVSGSAEGGELELEAAALVLAAGADQPPERLEREVVAGAPLLPRFAGKVVQSSEVLSFAGAAAVMERLARRASPKVAIVGGSHSAVSCARLLLDVAPGLRFGEGGVTVLHRRPLRLTYASAAAALAEGYTDFGPEDSVRRMCARRPGASSRSPASAPTRATCCAAPGAWAAAGRSRACACTASAGRRRPTRKRRASWRRPT